MSKCPHTVCLHGIQLSTNLQLYCRTKRDLHNQILVNVVGVKIFNPGRETFLNLKHLLSFTKEWTSSIFTRIKSFLKSFKQQLKLSFYISRLLTSTFQAVLGWNKFDVLSVLKFMVTRLQFRSNPFNDLSEWNHVNIDVLETHCSPYNRGLSLL